MNRLSASKLNLAERCTAWLDLPCVESTSEAAKIGSEVHKALQRLINGEPIDWLLSTAASKMQPKKAYDWLCSQIAAHVTSKTWPNPTNCWTRAEVAFAAGLDDAVELAIKDRAYPELPECTIVGTADVVVNFGEYGWILDWKTTSSHTGISKSAGLASENKQLAFLAYAASKCYGWTSCRVALVHIGPDGSLTDDWHEYAREELELLGIDMHDIASSARTPRSGMHCHDMYCPAIASCPAHAKLLAPLREYTIPRSLSEIQDDEYAVWLYAQAKAAERAAQQIRGLAEDYVRSRGEAVAGKFHLKVSTGYRETIKGDNAGKLAEIVEQWAPGCSREILTVSTSKSELERAIKDHAPKGKARAYLRECLAALDDAGFLSKSTFETFKFEEKKEK